jgi:hypothetical protein
MKITFIGLSAIALGVQTAMAINQCNCEPSDTTCLSKCGKLKEKVLEVLQMFNT